jgi:ribokinase
MSDKRFDVLAVADLCFDMLITGPQQPQFNQVELLVDDYKIDLGGSVGIFASQFSKLGGSIALIGNIGNDIPGDIILKRLREAGVNTDLISKSDTEHTAMGLNLFCKGDRAMLTYLGVMDRNNGSTFTEDLVPKARHWHIGGYFLLRELIPAWPAWMHTLKKNGITVSLDTNWDPSGNWEDVFQLLKMVDVFLPNENEALAITGKDDLIEAGFQLAEQCPLVVIKTGEKGAIVFKGAEKIEYSIPSSLLENLNIVDTTGAGDNFDAGFMFSWLSGKEEKICIETAFRCAVSSLNALGGIEKQISLKR